MKSGIWAKTKASPHESLWQSFEACLGSSQRLGLRLRLRLQLELDTVCHLCPKWTSSWPWHGELEPVSFTGFPGGQRGVCVWGGSLRGNPPHCPLPARIPSNQAAFCPTGCLSGSCELCPRGHGWGAGGLPRHSGGPPKPDPRGWGWRPQS